MGNEGITQEAVDLLEDQLSEVESTGYQRLSGEVHSLLAEMKLLPGDTSAARKHAEAAIALNGGLVSLLPLVIAYKTLFDITEQEGDTKAALELYKKYASAERGYRVDVAARDMAYQVIRAHSLTQGTGIGQRR